MLPIASSAVGQSLKQDGLPAFKVSCVLFIGKMHPCFAGFTLHLLTSPLRELTEAWPQKFDVLGRNNVHVRLQKAENVKLATEQWEGHKYFPVGEMFKNPSTLGSLQVITKQSFWLQRDPICKGRTTRRNTFLFNTFGLRSARSSRWQAQSQQQWQQPKRLRRMNLLLATHTWSRLAIFLINCCNLLTHPDRITSSAACFPQSKEPRRPRIPS